MGNVEDEIRDRVKAFADDLAMLVRRTALEAVQGAFAQNAPKVAAPVRSAPAKAPAPAPAAPRRAKSAKPAAAARRPGQKRDPRELTGLIERLADYIRTHPGQRVLEIKEALGVAATDLRFPIRKLLASGRIAAKGSKQTTTYTPR
jgi:hypothetical protein